MDQATSIKPPPTWSALANSPWDAGARWYYIFSIFEGEGQLAKERFPWLLG